MPEYSNSNKSKEGGVTNNETRPRPKIEKITDAEIVEVKKGPWKTFKGLIIEADMSDVGRYLWLDWIVPGIKNMILDTVIQGTSRTLYRDDRRGYRPSVRDIHRPPSSALGVGRGGVVDYVPYSDMARYPHDPRGAPQLSAPPVSLDERGFRIKNRDRAEETLSTMAWVIERYDYVSIADVHDMLDLPSTPIDNRWGWRDLSGSRIVRRNSYWVLELPEPMEIPV